MAQTAFCDGHKNAKTSSSPLLPTSYQRRKERGVERAKEREIQRSILVSPFFFFKQMSTFWPFEIQTGNFYVCSFIFSSFFLATCECGTDFGCHFDLSLKFCNMPSTSLGYFYDYHRRSKDWPQKPRRPRAATSNPSPCPLCIFLVLVLV